MFHCLLSSFKESVGCNFLSKGNLLENDWGECSNSSEKRKQKELKSALWAGNPLWGGHEGSIGRGVDISVFSSLSLSYSSLCLFITFTLCPGRFHGSLPSRRLSGWCDGLVGAVGEVWATAL